MLTSPIVGLSYAQWLLLLSNGAWSDTTVVVLSREMMWWRYGMFNSSNSSGSENFETFLLFLPNKAPVTEQSLPLYRNKGSKHNQQCLIWDENHWRLNGTWRSFIITHLAKSMTMLKKKMEFKTMFFILKCVFHSGLIESLLFPNSSASLSAVSCPIYSEGNVLDSTSSHYLGTKWQSRDQRPFMQHAEEGKTIQVWCVSYSTICTWRIKMLVQNHSRNLIYSLLRATVLPVCPCVSSCFN